jgi:glycosyltransferase involved in cell wall biosynthesis
MRQKAVVCIPTFNRPEFLALALEKIARASDVPEDIRIFLDTCSDARLDEVEYVRDTYMPTADIFRARLHVIAPSGTWNILNSLKQGFETGAEFVFFIEEDVMIKPEFFNEHLRMQSGGDYFVTCGRKLRNRDDSYYSNPGTCYRSDKLSLVVPHINMKYFADQVGYLDRHFPHMDDAGIMDDGLIRRVMQSIGARAKCAVPAIAAHQGFHYFAKFAQYQTVGSIAERIEQLRVMLAKVDPTDRYTRDFETLL